MCRSHALYKNQNITTVRICIMLKMIMLISAAVCCQTAVWAEDISGVWKTIDEQTGYSRADVTVKKLSNGAYTGKITAIRPLPFKPLVETCAKCKGPLKDAPYMGLEIISGFVQDPKKPKEYINGKILDPLSGKVYSGKAKLSENGRRLTMRGYVGVSALGRSTTWIRAD